MSGFKARSFSTVMGAPAFVGLIGPSRQEMTTVTIPQRVCSAIVVLSMVAGGLLLGPASPSAGATATVTAALPAVADDPLCPLLTHSAGTDATQAGQLGGDDDSGGGLLSALAFQALKSLIGVLAIRRPKSARRR